MGNCQAADAAAVVIQHPGDGKVERLHWPATAADVMRRNPGHYVALVVLHQVSGGGVGVNPAVPGEGSARITKVKLLKPRDTLHLGQVYRLITSQEFRAQTRELTKTRAAVGDLCGTGHVTGHGELPGGGRGGRGDPAPGRRQVERLHWPTTAADVMRRNPGHYVALVVLNHGDAEPDPVIARDEGARITKVKLLKPRDTLLLGQVYRLITSQEVSKAVQTRKQERMRGCDEAIERERPRLHRRRHPPRSRGDDPTTAARGGQRQPADHQERRRLETDRRHRSIVAASGRGRHWRPALQSITESSSSGHVSVNELEK